MKIRLLIVCVLICIAAIRQGYTQTTKFALEAGVLASSTGKLPFWLRANQYGENPYEANIFTIRGQVEKEYAGSPAKGEKRKNWDYGYKLRGIANLGSSNQFLLSEAYFKTRFKAVELYVGRRREIFGLADSSLGSGSYIWSGNALPMPKIQFSIPEYIPVLKNKLISVKGNFAHGWFGSDDSTKNYYLHQKSIYLRIGKPHWNINFHAGVNHEVQWGGKPTVPFIQGGSNSYINQYGSNLEAFFYVSTGKPLVPGGKFYSGNLSGEGGNRLGNHLGTVDFAIEYNAPKVNIFLYKQSVYEDGTLSGLSNIFDGLYGVSISMKERASGVLKVNFEFLDTRNQGGPLSSQGIVTQELRGRDNYFNNGTYENGWVYKRNTIGTPFLMPMAYSPSLSKTFSSQKINPYYILNNRVKAYHVGLYSRIKSVSLKTRFSLSENLGNYAFSSIDVWQLSIMQQVVIPIKKYEINMNLGFDNSGLFDKGVGVVFLVKRFF